MIYCYSISRLINAVLIEFSYRMVLKFYGFFIFIKFVWRRDRNQPT